MVCSSILEYCIPLGEDIYEWLLSQFQQYDLHILLVLSQNYYNSPACLNEMGAAWVLKSRYDTILLPGFEYRDIKGAVNPNKIGLKLDDCEEFLNKRLDELKDGLLCELDLPPLNESKWKRNRAEFLNKINHEMMNHPSPGTEAPTESVPKLSEDATNLLITISKDQGGELLVIGTLGGPLISSNHKQIHEPSAGIREEARWLGAIDELERFAYIKAVTSKRQVFKITREGYAFVDGVSRPK